MKKFLACFLICTVMFGIIPASGVFAADESDRIYILEEDFSGYDEPGLPSGWQSFSGGAASGGGITADTGKEGNALKISSANGVLNGGMKVFENKLDASKSFTIEFDLCAAAQSGFYLALLGEDDIKETADTGKMIYEKQFIGMASTGGGTITYPRIAYADGKGGVVGFGDKDTKIVKAPEWNHIEINVMPISSSRTKLSLKINSAAAVEAETETNFTETDIYGIGLAAAPFKRDVDDKYVKFDNVKVYTYNSAPKINNVEFISDGESQSESNISALTEEIRISFDVSAEFDDLRKQVTLTDAADGTKIDITSELDQSGKKLGLRLNEPMTGGREYLLTAENGYLRGNPQKIMEPYSYRFTAAADEFKINSVQPYIRDKEIADVTDAVDLFRVKFNHKINPADTDRIYIISSDGNKIENISVTIAEEGKTAEVSTAGVFEADKEYTLKIDEVRSRGFGSVTVNSAQTFTVKKDVIAVMSIGFFDADGTEYANLGAIPYNLYNIRAGFDKEINPEGLDSLIGIDGLSEGIRTEVSDDGKTVNVILENTVLQKGSSMTFRISGKLSYIGNEKVNVGNDVTVKFNVSTEAAYNKKLYLDENFNDFVPAANGSKIPDGWYCMYDYFYGGVRGVNGPDGDGDMAIHLKNDSVSPYLIKRFYKNELLSKGAPFIMELDINRMGGVSVIWCGVSDYHNLTNHDPDPYWPSQNVNVAIMDGVVKYPNTAWTNNNFSDFIDPGLNPDDDGYRLIVPDEGWHRLKIEYRPSDVEKTILKVSLDGGKVYTAETKLDFFTWLPAGGYINPSTGGVGVAIDNFKIYVPSEVKAPELQRVSIADVFGNSIGLDETVATSAAEILLQFDSKISLEEIDDYIKLTKNGEALEANFSADESGLFLSMKPKCLLEKNSTYCIEVNSGIKYADDSRFVSSQGYKKYFRTGDEEFFEVCKSEWNVENADIEFSFDVMNSSGEDKKLIAVIASFKETEINGTKYQKLTGMETEMLDALNGMVNHNTIVSKNIKDDEDKICAYIISADDGRVLFTNQK